MARRRLRAQAESEVPGVTSLQPLAVGGNSTVYRAWQPELDRWVAVKVLGLTLSDARARDRFLRECSAVGRLTGHPAIVTVLASGVTRTDRPFLIMDLFERGSLADQIAASGPVSAELALRYGVKLAGALETAHRAGILHRDLKPENVLLSRFGEPALADFGIATLGEARGGTEAFTPTHAAPEVLDGRQATAAADVYGLGSTLWTALAGRLPFGDGDQGPLKLMLRVLQDPVPPIGRADVPAEVEEAMQWAMAKEPAQRAPTAEEFGQHLRTLQAQLGLPVSELVVPDELDHLGAPGPDGSARPPDPPPPSPAATTIRPVRHDARLPVPPPPAAPERQDPPAPPEPPVAVPPVPAHEPAGPDLAATVVRPRAAPPPPPVHREAVTRKNVGVGFAIVSAALVLALALVGVAVLATGDDEGSSAPSTTAATPATVVAGPSSTGLATTSAAPPAAARTATAVVVTEAGPLTVTVTWRPPADRTGLIGYVVAHRPRLGSGQVTTTAVSDPNAVTTEIVLSTAGPRCFVVQSIYATGSGAPSDAACT